MNTASIESPSTARSRHRRATPWGVRLLLGVSILFGLWVDISSIGSSAPGSAPNASLSTGRNQIHLLGLTDENSTVGALVKTLASRRS